MKSKNHKMNTNDNMGNNNECFLLFSYIEKVLIFIKRNIVGNIQQINWSLLFVPTTLFQFFGGKINTTLPYLKGSRGNERKETRGKSFGFVPSHFKI